MSEKIKWTICDDAEHIRFVYATGLKKYKELEFIGSTETAKECLEFVSANNPDICLLDIQLETETAGLDVIEKIKDASPDTKIIILSSYNDEEYIFKAFAVGVDGYVLKDYPLDRVYENIIDVYNQRGSVSNEIAQVLAKKARDIRSGQKSMLRMIEIMSHLSVSEFEVLKEIYKGKSYRTIAEERFVDVSTVKVQASRILKKVGISNMAELIPQLQELKIFDLFGDR